jgi:probable HAF family extracellular repeat protein
LADLQYMERLLPAFAIAVASTASVIHAQTVRGLGFLPGGGYSWARAVSDDGSIVVGFSGTANGGTSAFRWTQAQGMIDIGLPGAEYSQAFGVSNDGSVAVGASTSSDGHDGAFRWTAQGGAVDLGVLAGDTDAAGCGVSGDGSTAVGYCYNRDTHVYHAFRWTPAQGMTPLGEFPGGTFSLATAISRDGSVIVGYGDAPGCQYDAAIIWRSGGPHVLDSSPQQEFTIFPSAVNGDGSVVVGGFNSFTRWDARTGPVDLGFRSDLRGPNFALSCNARGTLIGGCAGDPGIPQTGVLWTPNDGLVDARWYLSAAGVDMQGWFPASCTGITPDGRVIVGVATHFLEGGGSSWEAYLATIPRCGSPDFDRDGSVGTDSDIESFFACMAGRCCPTCDRHGADFDGDGAAGTDADLEAFFRVLSGGPC